MDDDDDHPVSNNVVVLLIAMGSAAFVVSMYHLIAIFLCYQRITSQNPPHTNPPQTATPSTVVQMIPTHTYRRKKPDDATDSGDGGGDGGEGGTCAVCLGEFEEGEELRTLPECMHCFHMACIDKWLYSHSSCPICRSTATPSAEVLHSDHDLNNPYEPSSIDMPQFSVVQNAFGIPR